MVRFLGYGQESPATESEPPWWSGSSTQRAKMWFAMLGFFVDDMVWDKA
jgi:hypothetical protein